MRTYNRRLKACARIAGLPLRAFVRRCLVDFQHYVDLDRGFANYMLGWATAKRIHKVS